MIYVSYPWMSDVGPLSKSLLKFTDEVCCSVLQCAAVCCSVLQCAAVFCIVLCRRVQQHLRRKSHVSHMNGSCHTDYFFCRAHMNESCHLYAWVMTHVRMSHVTQITLRVEHIWMSHVTCIIESRHTDHDLCRTRMNESCHVYEWVMSHVWMSHVTQIPFCVEHVWMSHVTCMNESCPTYEWAI